MATPTDVARRLLRSSTKIAQKINDAPTGITPGYDPLSGVAWGENGRARYRKGGLPSANVLAQASGVPTATVSSPENVINYASVIYDPGAIITTGAAWACALNNVGFYEVFATVAINELSEGIDPGEYWDLSIYDADTATQLHRLNRKNFYAAVASGGSYSDELLVGNAFFQVTSAPLNVQMRFVYNNSLDRRIVNGGFTVIARGS